MVRDQRWQRIEELYHAALERDPSERAAFLLVECAGDDTLRRDVESLLAEGEAAQFLATPALELAGREIAASGEMLIGRQIGPYQVHSLLGTGGMGEVYRARDSKLHRDVAIKVLPSAVAHDRDRLSRFAREARLLAALNHPHIAAIHGLEEADGISALVLELVEGETLADRIARGPIKTADAIAIAKQIVDGLESAHEKGIVHRDLKPANIKLRPDGHVKILDFGLAKALAPAHTDDHVSVATGVSSVTQIGVVTGTPAYMSPEQAQGQPVDERTDIWAFGCVLYEMLTGRPVFAGKSMTETLAAVITAEPAWDALPRDLSPSIGAFLRACLSKDLRQRVSHINDVRLALDGTFDTPGGATVKPATTRLTWPRTFALAGVAAVLALITGLAVWAWSRTTSAAPIVARFSISVPPGQRLSNPLGNHHLIAISPRGTHIVYTTDDALWLRPVDALEATVLRGRETDAAYGAAYSLFFSPDGQWVGFHAGTQLQKVALTGGPSVVIAAADVPFGATWEADDRILYGQGPRGIWQVAATGGTPEQVIAVEEGEQAHGPQALRDGTVLYTLLPRGAASWDDAQIVVQARGSGERTVVIMRGRDARYLPTGHLVYAVDNVLLAVPFDVRSHRVTGNPVSLVQGIVGATSILTGAVHFSVSANGTLVYVPRPSAQQRTLVWVDRRGREEPLPFPLPFPPGKSFVHVRVSPDRRRVVASRNPDGIWVSDLSRPTWSRIASGPNVSSPIWTTDSNDIVYSSLTAGDRALYRTSADGAGAIERLATIEQVSAAHAVTRDGQLVFSYGTLPELGLGLLQMGAVNGREREWKPLLERNASVSSLSPDGRWIAYCALESGRFVVYIRRFPELTDRRLISPAPGGGWPVFSPDWSSTGGELFYRRLGDGAMMSVRIQTAPTVTVGPGEVLFENKMYAPLDTTTAMARMWDLASDGRFLMIKDSSSPNARAVTLDVDDSGEAFIVVQNWTEELKHRVPAR